jgi:hypothetical protein
MGSKTSVVSDSESSSSKKSGCTQYVSSPYPARTCIQLISLSSTYRSGTSSRQALPFYPNGIEDVLLAFEESELVEQEIIRSLHTEAARGLVEDIQMVRVTFRSMFKCLRPSFIVARYTPTSPTSPSSTSSITQSIH